ncbi:MAG TPA: radical SAM protein [Desulfatiglandales bacterium]|nr:radical SAM protein [Desulfatiglandales bacterium]
MGRDIIFIQPTCGKYDLFILDMPLGLLYAARLLIAEGYNVHIVDQRVEKGETFTKIKKLLENEPLWVGLTVMTGEPIHHALVIARFVRKHSNVPIVLGGIHPTILPEQTLRCEWVDYVIRGKGEYSALALSRYLENSLLIENVPGLTWMDREQHVRNNPEDDESDWGEMPIVPYHLIDVSKYSRVGFNKKIFSIMTSRNCPYRCTFCYNSSLKKKKRWMPDGLEYIKRHIDYIIEKFKPEYLSFIDDVFFVDKRRAWKILSYLEGRAPNMKIGFRGARVSELIQLEDKFFDLMERLNTRHINIGVESGSPNILKAIRKGITVEQVIQLNRRFANRSSFIPLYNFFSGIPQETEEDLQKTTDLIMQLVEENPHCQISGYHQYTPYPGNELFKKAVRHGFHEPNSLEEWSVLHFEDNAQNCPWIDKKRRRLLDTLYSMIYFVDNKYETYIAKHNLFFKALVPLVQLYKPIARLRLRRHITAFPVEILAKDLIYRLLSGSTNM